jgi:hypothetical protein
MPHTQWEAVRVNEVHRTHSQLSTGSFHCARAKMRWVSIHHLPPLVSSHHPSSRALFLTPFARVSLLIFQLDRLFPHAIADSSPWGLL